VLVPISLKVVNVSTDGASVLEKANVSDGPPVEHSIMKRAWPYALALAVVVTGCYLALAPLLRSLSPAPASTANRLSQNQNNNVETVNKAKGFAVVSSKPGKITYVTGLKKKAKKAKKAKKSTTNPTKKSTTTNAPSQSTATTGFANNAPSSSSSSSTPAPKSTTTTPKATATTPTSKAASKKKTGSASVGGGIDQGGGAGFAGQTGGGSVVGGQTLAPGN
jgi:hypothetical protein